MDSAKPNFMVKCDVFLLWMRLLGTSNPQREKTFFKCRLQEKSNNTNAVLNDITDHWEGDISWCKYAVIMIPYHLKDRSFLYVI